MKQEWVMVFEKQKEAGQGVVMGWITQVWKSGVKPCDAELEDHPLGLPGLRAFSVKSQIVNALGFGSWWLHAAVPAQHLHRRQIL